MAQAGFHPVGGGAVGEASLPKHQASRGPPKGREKKEKGKGEREREREKERDRELEVEGKGECVCLAAVQVITVRYPLVN